ncbi:MAG TPA: pyridoxal phosphate-dependent aminotransferase [Myxococcaceae bacterium]|nr:pyridoxal phosphate-dependent aminotransferase [Myxococcaceae bacterium]
MFSARTAWDRTQNLLSARLEMLVRRGTAPIDLTVTSPADCGLGPDEGWLRGVLASQPLAAYAPEPLGQLVARQALARDLTRLGAHLEPGQFVLSASTSEAYGWLFALLCDPGDSVLVPAPSYPLLPFLAELSSVELRSFPLPDDPLGALDLDTLEAIADETTRAVVLVSPANPTGWVLGEADQARLDALCAGRDWGLVVDEVFVEFPRRGRAARSVAARPGEALTFALQGLSKSVGLPGWKLAWTAVLGPAPERDEALARLELIADTHLSGAAPVQHALADLLSGSAAWRTRVALRLDQNTRALHDARPPSAAWDVMPSEGGWSAVVRLPHTAEETAVCLELLDAGVQVQPGHFYDFPRGRWLVLSLLPTPARFDEGARRMARTLGRLFPAP